MEKKLDFKIGYDLSPVLGNKTGVEYYALRLYETLDYVSEGSVIAFSNHAVPEIPNAVVRPSALPLCIWRQFCLPGLLRKYGVSSLHSPVTSIPVFAGVPVVSTVHDLSYRNSSGGVSLPAKLTQILWCMAAVSVSGAVVAVSDTTCEKLKSFYPAQSAKFYAVLSGALVRSPFTFESESPSFFEKLKITKPYFIQIGRIDVRKSPVVTLNAFRQSGLKEQLMVFVGSSGNASGEVELWIKENPDVANRVFLLNYQPSSVVQLLLANASALIYPSSDEGFGHPPFEALNAGVPPIVSDIPVMREVLGDSAHFFAVNSVIQLAEAMRHVVLHPNSSAEVVAQGRVRISELSWERTAAEIIRIHSELARRKH